MVGVISVFVLFAFFLAEYTTFFWVKQRYGGFWGFVAVNVVGAVFGGALLIPLAHIGTLDLVAQAAP